MWGGRVAAGDALLVDDDGRGRSPSHPHHIEELTQLGAAGRDATTIHETRLLRFPTAVYEMLVVAPPREGFFFLLLL